MISKSQLEKLYGSGLSMMDISIQTGFSHSKITYWMNKYNIPRRTRDNATYIKKNPKGDPFRIKKNLTKQERELKGLGIGLYWGEGDKSDYSSVRLGNTDPGVIKKFRDFLIEVCGVKKDKFKYGLQLFNDSNEDEAVSFWIRNLNLRRDDLGKISKMIPRGKGNYKNKNHTGVMTIYCHNKKLTDKIISMLR